MFDDLTETETYSEPEPSFLSQAINFIRGLVETVATGTIIAFIIILFVAQGTRVYGQSMEPNLHTDQRLVVEKLSYNNYLRHYLQFSGPHRGDVIVVSVPSQGGELLIKRLVGLPGDTIAIHDGQVYLNDVPLNEPYLEENTLGTYGPVTVPPLHIFVLGDNRNFSNDSRNFGTVPIDNVIGRAWFSYWPLEDVGFIE